MVSALSHVTRSKGQVILSNESHILLAYHSTTSFITSRMRSRKCTAVPAVNTRDVSRRESLRLVLGLVSADLMARIQLARASSEIDPLELPNDFVELAYDLIEALRDSIDADLSGAEEREVRRKAEPAKELVKRYINSWSGSSAIADATACREIRNAVQELGEFYRSNGQRQRMSESVASSILGHLNVAEGALPERKEKRIFPF